MTPDDILTALKGYESEVEQILSRFTRNRDGIHIAQPDNYRLRAIVTELIDLLRDHVHGSGQHIHLVANSYNEGVSNMYRSSSYASVEEVRGVISAVVTRIERNKNLFAEPTGPVSVTDSEKILLDALDRTVLRFYAVAVQLGRMGGA